jgi:hypothetical protein
VERRSATKADKAQVQDEIRGWKRPKAELKSLIEGVRPVILVGFARGDGRALGAVGLDLDIPLHHLDDRQRRRVAGGPAWPFYAAYLGLLIAAGESRNPRRGRFENRTGGLGFRAIETSDSVTGNLILDSTRCHEAVCRLSRSAGEDEYPRRAVSLNGLGGTRTVFVTAQPYAEGWLGYQVPRFA